jgi:glyoxylase-like metal-dependent hydrolase (beta-lactamase superfamily II)
MIDMKQINRRNFLKASATLSGVVLASLSLPRAIVAKQAFSADTGVLNKFRASFGAMPIVMTKLGGNLTLLSGPGGNVVVSDGNDGKLMIDTFVQPAWPKLKEALDSISANPITQVIDTHWHFDHVDNNASLRATGARVLAHKNVPRRMKEFHEIAAFNIQFPPSPPEALPTETFSGKREIDANGEKLRLEHASPAHTDSDIFIYFPNSNVIHCGDLVTNNGGFPLIDYDSGGKIGGMIKASKHIISIIDSKTRVIPGHGSISDKDYLIQYHERLVTIHDQIAELDKKGLTLPEIIGENPLEDLKPVWGHGAISADQYTDIVYHSL